jgi:hypothetical protein
MSEVKEQAERLSVLRQDKSARDGSTYAAHAEAAADPVGGRFAHLAPPKVVKGGPDYPPIPSGPWAAPDPSGDEPPLGFDVNALD